MPFCGQRTLIVHQPDHVSGSPLRCRSWGCEYCFQHRLRALRTLAASGEPDKFLTLTLRRDSHDTPDDAAVAMSRALRSLLQWVRRHYHVKHIAYLAVFEAHKSGWPHLHVLLRMPYVPQAELSAEWERLTGSPVVYITAIRSRRGASVYIAKYVSKGPGKWEGVKRYWRSQSYALDSDDGQQHLPVADRSYYVSAHSIDVAADRYILAGWLVEWPTDNRFQATASRGSLAVCYGTGPPH